MGVSTRTRFEIFKRDGFRCKYCGANAAQTLLHVDHVVAIANGGTDDAENLVTACADCNLGKSDVPLEKVASGGEEQREAIAEHAEQIKAYLRAVREREEAKDSLDDAAIGLWQDLIDERGMPKNIANSLRYWIQSVGLEGVFEAIRATSAKGLWGEQKQSRYFIACVRNMRDRITGAQERAQ